MYVAKFSIALVLFSIASFSSALAMEIPQEYKWIPRKFDKQRADIIERLKKEEDDPRSAKINNTGNNEKEDYGFSFPGVNPVRELCLGKICEHFTATNIRPSVLDAGAGFGYMSWKILAAGGCVTAIEQQEPTAKTLGDILLYRSILLFEDEKYYDLFQVRVGNICDNILDIYKPDSYDITWTGHVLHFLTPTQILDYTENLFKITKPGGCAYATANPVVKVHDGVIKYFQERKDKKEPYPGFFIVDFKLRYKYDQIEKTKNQASRDILTFHHPRKELYPGQIYNGLYNGKKLKNQPYPEYVHRSIHVFDPESLSYFFEKAGFIVEQAFYFNAIKILSHDENPNEAFALGMAVGIVARKPVNMENK